ncbi:MAG: glycosyltransferase, partial [Bifidobacteriaceae bacterium]|nr:glycosyltransferase [Bifidobacteriaceae bacterium]
MSVYQGDQPGPVAEAFHSVTDGQTLQPTQVVVVQDGPVPVRLEVLLEQLAARPDVTLVRLPRNRGLDGALNAGLAACRYEVVARQDADDVSTPQRFALTVPLVADGTWDVVGGALREFQPQPPVVGRLAGGGGGAGGGLGGNAPDRGAGGGTAGG